MPKSKLMEASQFSIDRILARVAGLQRNLSGAIVDRPESIPWLFLVLFLVVQNVGAIRTLVLFHIAFVEACSLH